jgi:hypothetical protein
MGDAPELEDFEFPAVTGFRIDDGGTDYLALKSTVASLPSASDISAILAAQVSKDATQDTAISTIGMLLQ